MAIGTDRYASRADTLLFIACVGLSIAALSLPNQWRDPLAQGLRQSVLAPFLFLQRQSELLAAARYRYDAVVAQRDSTSLAATFLPELRSENARLRALLGLSQRLGTGYVSAEILHQPEPTNPLSFVVSAGKREGVRPLSAVVSPEGLVGLVATVDEHTSVVLSWAHPEFRASAIATDGSVVGIAAPHGAASPRGIPTGTVIGPAGEEKGWGRTYLVRPAVHPAALSHVMILTTQGRPGADLRNAFTVPQDSATAGTGTPPE